MAALRFAKKEIEFRVIENRSRHIEMCPNINSDFMSRFLCGIKEKAGIAPAFSLRYDEQLRLKAELPSSCFPFIYFNVFFISFCLFFINLLSTVQRETIHKADWQHCYRALNYP